MSARPHYMIGTCRPRMSDARFNVRTVGWGRLRPAAENAAIKNGTHTKTWTLEKSQLKGNSRIAALRWGTEMPLLPETTLEPGVS